VARRLPVVSGKAALRALRRAGYVVRHIRGSQHVLFHPGPPARIVSIPVHGNQELRLGTLSGIIEQAGLTVEEFISLL
jgi:predicted RNA binding protein YcfA (HicA-like mRNA interferase family)